MHKEEWLDIPEFIGIYQASNIGRIRRVDKNEYLITPHPSFHNSKIREILLSPVNSNGYKRAILSIGGKPVWRLVHRLVASAFIPNPDGLPIVNHINSIRSDNHVENLEWCTHLYNMRHAAIFRRSGQLTGTEPIEMRTPRNIVKSRFTENELIKIAKRYFIENENQTQIANHYNVNQSTICRAINYIKSLEILKKLK